MLEPMVLGFLALVGIACTAILAFLLVHSGWRLDRRRGTPVGLEVDDRDDIEVEPWAPASPVSDRYRAEEIFSIMHEHFPAEYRRYRDGKLGPEERRWTWDSCRAIADARVEIEEICG